MLNQFIDQVKGEIEAWSERGSGWIMDKILEAYVNVARYQPMRGGSYMPLPKKLQNKKAIINVQNRDNECIRWAIRAPYFLLRAAQKSREHRATQQMMASILQALIFQRRLIRLTGWRGRILILLLIVFGWENGNVVVYKISEKRWRNTENQLNVNKAIRKRALQLREKTIGFVV